MTTPVDKLTEKPLKSLTDAEIVRELAVEGMGWTIDADMRSGTWYRDTKGELVGIASKLPSLNWNPLTDANDRDMLVLKMIEDGCGSVCVVHGTQWGSNKFYAMVERRLVKFEARADTAGRAVCLAALKALRASKEGEA